MSNNSENTEQSQLYTKMMTAAFKYQNARNPMIPHKETEEYRRKFERIERILIEKRKYERMEKG